MKKILLLVVLFWPIKVFALDSYGIKKSKLFNDLYYQDSMKEYIYHDDVLSSLELFDTCGLDITLNDNKLSIKGRHGLYFIAFKMIGKEQEETFYMRVMIRPVKLHVNRDDKYKDLCLRLYENNKYIKDICLNDNDFEIDRTSYSLKLINNNLYQNKEYILSVEDDYYLDVSFEDKVYDINSIMPNLDEYYNLPGTLIWGIYYV